MGEILTTEALAKKLGVSEQRVRQLKDELGLNPVRIGNAITYNKAEARKIKNRLEQLEKQARGKPRTRNQVECIEDYHAFKKGSLYYVWKANAGATWGYFVSPDIEGVEGENFTPERFHKLFGGSRKQGRKKEGEG